MANKESYSILVVDDERDLRELIVHAVSSFGYRVSSAVDGVEGINLVNTNRYDVVLLDIQMPKVDGLEVLEHIKSHSPSTEVVLLTGVRDVRIAVRAMKLGALDYLTKPVQLEELEVVLEKCVAQKNLRTNSFLMQRSLERLGSDSPVIGQSETWISLLEKAKKFAVNDFLIYVEGESGTGKEVLANYIHQQSPRKDKPFITVDCGVVHGSLIESELFGHVKGSFTGADSNKEGLVEVAHGGTLFLDEIGHIDLTFQQKLLKFVETKSYRRVGDTTTRTVDVRIVAATNKNLADEVKAERFRSDLWYRLNVMKLELPPLRERKGDIRLLAEHYIRKFTNPLMKKELTPESVQLLERHSWFGNVRELQSTIQRAIALSDDDKITPEDLGIELNISVAIKAGGTAAQQELVSLRTLEQNHIYFVLTSVNWNISQAAKILQIGRNTLYAKMKDLGIEAEQK